MIHPAFRQALLDWEPDLIIAADSGVRHLLEMKLVPGLLLGDMDSIEPRLLEEAYGMGLEPRIYPSHKDETDTELALSIALEEAGADAQLRVIGASGTRVDHTQANLHLLNRYYSQLEFWDGGSRLWILHGPAVDRVARPDWFCESRTTYFSFLPFGSPIRSITLEGFEYPLDHYDMDINAVIGTSNQLKESCGRVSFDRGTLLCCAVQE